MLMDSGVSGVVAGRMARFWKLLSIALLPLAGAAACGDSATQPEAVPGSPFYEDRVLNIAHRGANRRAPEETLEAYHEAKKVGVDVLEGDIHRTRDGAIVVMHDSTVDRTTSGTGAIRDMTLAEIKALDAGYNYTRDDGATYPFRGQGLQVPTLIELLETFPDDFMIIEIKGSDPSVSADYAAVLAENDAFERVITASFDEDVLKAFRAAAPGALTSLAQNEVIAFFGLTPEGEAAYTPPGEFLHVPPTFSGIEVMTPEFVARADRFDLPIHVFGTRNSAEVMQAMIDVGARGLMVDDVDLAKEVIEANQ